MHIGQDFKSLFKATDLTHLLTSEQVLRSDSRHPYITRRTVVNIFTVNCVSPKIISVLERSMEVGVEGNHKLILRAFGITKPQRSQNLLREVKRIPLEGLKQWSMAAFL